MKSAILFFGQYREFDSCAPIWKEQFEREMSCDFYLSTWSNSRQKYNYLEIDTPENIKDISVSEKHVKEIIPNCMCSILDENKIFYDNTPQDGSDFRSRSIRQSKMFYHWKNLQRMVKDSQKDYDLFVLLRTDVTGIVCNDDSTTKNAIKNWKFNRNILYCDSNMVLRLDDNNKLSHLVNDYMFCGSPKIMNKFFDVIPDMTLDVNKYHNWTPHIDLANMLIKENLYVSNLHPFKVRGLSRPKIGLELGYEGFSPVFGTNDET